LDINSKNNHREIAPQIDVPQPTSLNRSQTAKEGNIMFKYFFYFIISDGNNDIDIEVAPQIFIPDIEAEPLLQEPSREAIAVIKGFGPSDTMWGNTDDDGLSMSYRALVLM